MTRERFEASLAFVLKWEGSKFTNDPDDRGGATKFGIIQREYDSFRRRRGLPTHSVQFITMDEARDIYRREYWDAVQGDVVPDPLDVVAFDTGVLMGVGRSVRLLQQSLRVGIDGDIGPETRAALARANAPAVAARMADLREARLRSIVERDPSQAKFLRGWLNRLNDLRRLIPHGDAPSLGEDEGAMQELTPDEETSAGRALADLPGDFPEEGGAERVEPAAIDFFKTVGVEQFRKFSASLSEYARHPRHVIDVRASGEDVLVVSSGSSGSDFFELPAATLEALIPLGLHEGDPTKVIAALLFRPEFRTLAASLGSRGGAPLGGVAAASAEACLEQVRETDEDEDPAHPSSGETELDIATARSLTNYGAVEPGTDQPALSVEFAELEGAQAVAARPEAARTMPIDIAAARSFLDSCMTSSPRVRYGLGAKVPFHGAKPGRNFKKVDCSGFVREAIWRATTPHLNFPDGSVVQRDWVIAQGFARSTTDAALLRDGAVRIAFLRPQDAPSGIGHVVLVHNARTLESHSGVGPNTRPWTKTGWQARAIVFLLTPPRA